jgi:hypothetical protein
MKILIPLILCASPVLADAPLVQQATATRGGDSWRISVTLLHPDTGWEHYADAWRVEDASGAVLGTRILLHPHENEQPFTRSQSGIAIPSDLTQVHVRSRCLVDGWSEGTFVLTLP